MSPALALLLADLVVSPSTTQVRYGAGIVLLQEQTSEGDSVRILDRRGTTLRVLFPTRILRRSRVHDMTVVDSSTVAVSVSTPGTLGPAVQQIIVFPQSGEPHSIDTGKAVCYLIASDGHGGFWCLGPSLDSPATRAKDPPLLSHWDQRGARIGAYLPKSSLPALDHPDETTVEPYQTSDIGPPQLLPAGPGRLVAWLPLHGIFAVVDAHTDRVERRTMPVPRAGRATISFAISPAGTRYALLPDRPHGAEETFLTPYLLYRSRTETAWEKVPHVPPLSRSSYLLGVDKDSLVVWLRAERRVRWIQVE